jgi:type I restriction-modification system DNA methylase subunit
MHRGKMEKKVIADGNNQIVLFPSQRTEIVDNDICRQFQTPIPVVEYMCNLIPAGVQTVLEPTPGLGHIVSRLNGYDVTAPADFFLLDKKQRYDCVVMNPPFSSKSAILTNAPEGFEDTGMRVGYYFLTECMKLSDNVIALMPWFTISDSDVRLRFIKSFGLVSLTALPRKTFEYARIQTCVFHLQKGFKGDTIFKTFEF